ncbi:MAG: GEVED domain-containing protein, partial [Planctomycetaceae bacterium]
MLNTGTGPLTFQYKFTPEAGRDKFQVYIDGVGDGAAAFETSASTGGGFATASVPVIAGSHTFLFIYSKDSDGTPSTFDDGTGVVLDNVVFPNPNGGYFRGDRNLLRQQGNFVVENNVIRDVSQDGINIKSDTRDPVTGMAHQGTPINFLTLNSERLAPGVVVTNNVIARFGSDGIDFGGDAIGLGNVPPAAVPFGKIINNTIVGDLRAGTVGIRVSNNASPTLLNNLIVNTATGISVDVTSGTTIVARTYFRGNGVNVVGAANGNQIADNAANLLFVNAAVDNYYLAGDTNPLDGIFDGALPIDRSLKSLADRTNYLAVKTDLGIPASDIVSPTRDAYGQLRVDDPLQPPSGVGGEIFNDVGAVERADFLGPYVSIVAPTQDNSTQDLENVLTVLHVDNVPLLTQFVVTLLDTGIGIDDRSLKSSQFQLWQNGVLLLENTDYLWRYNTNTNSVFLISPSVFAADNIYTIKIDNTLATGVLDLAGNRLQANQADGTTQFVIKVTDGVNDPPVNTIPALQTLDEDTSIVFNTANGNGITVSDKDAFIGDNRLMMTLQAVNGRLSLPASASLGNLTFTAGSGSAGALDVLKTFEGDISDLNLALDGLLFVPDQDYFGPAQIIITTNDRGQFSGPPSLPAQTISTVQLTVLPVNDKPTFSLLPVAQSTIVTSEDANTWTSVGLAIINNVDPGGPPYEATPPVGSGVVPQTVSATWTVTATTGSWTTVNFFSALNVDAATGKLTFTTNPDVNGTATISIEMVDSLGLRSDPRVITINVTRVNDVPVYTLAPGQTDVTDLENQGLKTAAFVSSFAAARGTALDEILLPANGGQTTTWTPVVTVTSGNLQFDTIRVLANGMIEYKTKQDKYGTADVTFTLSDNGGLPGVNTAASKLVKFTIQEINDAPVNVVPGNQTTFEDTPLLFGTATGNAIFVGDPDIYLGNNTLQVTLTAVHGTITLNGLSGLAFTVGDGTSDAVMTFSGDVAAINAALNEMVFTPEQDYFVGLPTYPTASLTVFTNDRGQYTSVGLPARTDSDTVNINVISVNDPPTVDPLALPIIDINEDSGFHSYPGYLTGLSGGPANEDQTLTAQFLLKSITSSWTEAEFFTIAPRIVFDTLTPTGRLEFQVAPNVNGIITYDLRVVDSDGLPDDSASIRQFSIQVAPINDKPTFNAVPTPPTILEDAGAQIVPLFVQNASAGPRDESQLLTAQLTVTGTTGSWLPGEFFSVPPAVNMTVGSPNYGRLTYTVAPNVNGTATVSIVLRDTALLASDARTFVISVTAVNDRPVFNTISNPPTVNEDAGLQTVNGFVSGQSAGPRDEPQTLISEIIVSSVTGSWNAGNFFAAGGLPVVNPVTGRLTYQTAQDANGSATLSILLRDSVGLASVAQTFTITVTAVNDKPVFTLDPLVVPTMMTLEDIGLSVYNIVSAFDAARSTALDEIGRQTPLTWIAGTPTITSGTLVFDSFSILPNGQLQFKSRLNTAGTATVTLQLRDNGGGAPNNLSDIQTLNILVANVNDRPMADTGNYVMDAGENLTLNASATSDPDLPFGDVLTYIWDLNGDGVYETSTGTNSIKTLTWAQLLAAGVTAPAEYNASLLVTDTAGLFSSRSFLLSTLTVDYGDAPNSFGTLKTSSGAAHVLVGNLWLGAGVTGDFNGQPSAAANLDTDNGVVFTSLFERTANVSLPTTMNVTASIAGKLDAWLDLNRNGIFEASERTAYDVVAGVNSLAVMIPPTASLGATHMRFRISTSGNLQPTGRVIGGEVEDYAVTITQLPTPQTPVIIKPVDFNLTDGRVPYTTDLTPRVEWQDNPNNHHFTVIVRNVGGTAVFTRTNVAANQVDVTTTLMAGDYTVSVTAFDRAGVAAPAANYAFKVVPIAVSAPVGDIVTHRPIVSWNAVEGSKSYTVEITSVRTGLVVHTAGLNAATPGFLPNYSVPTNLALGQFTVRVRAVDAADLLGDWSPPSAFNVRTPTTITAPTGTLLNLRPTVTWTPVFSATSYLLVLTNVTDGEEAFRVSGLTTTSWTPTADLKMADYSVSVRGFNATGDSSNWSAPRLFRVNQIAVATAPTGRVGTTMPTFNWPRILGSDSFELIINRGYGNKGVQFSGIIPASDSYTLTSALPLGNYSFKFRQINFPTDALTGTQVSTAFSVPYNFIVAAAPTVTSLSPKADPNIDWATLSNRPTFNWTNPPGAEKSDIWIAQVGGNPRYLLVNGISGTSFTPNQDIGIGTYTFWVRTYSNTDNPATTADERIASNWSQEQQFKVVTQPVAPPIGRVKTGRPTFSWSAVPGAITYEVWLSNDSDVISPYSNVTAIAALNYTPTTNLPVGHYTFWVRATNGLVQHSYWSVPYKFEVAAAPVLSGPPRSTFVTKPVFTWNNMAVPVGNKTAGADSYDFLLYKVDPVTFRYTALPLVTGLTSPTYTIPTDLAIGQYRAVVRAFVNGRVTTPTLRGVNPTYTEFSNSIDFSVGGVPIVNPIPDLTDRTPTISWQAVQGAAKYDVFISTATSTTALIRQNGVTGTSYTVATPLAPGAYRVWVRAISSDGTKTSSWSNPVDWTISSTNQPVNPLESASELILAVVPHGIPELTVTSTTVSLADFDDSEYPTAPVRSTDGTSDTPIVLPVTRRIDLVPETAPIAIEESSAENTDDVLAAWDQQLWWERSASDAVTLPVSANDSAVRTSKSSASFGILGALLTLVPKAIRRKR